jgi:hypothetical protein
MKASEIYGRMTVQYGNNCMSQKKVYKWMERLKGGQMRWWWCTLWAAINCNM